VDPEPYLRHSPDDDMGVRCNLVRDLTDAMYNPARRPFVSHDHGTELVIEHIEKYWRPLPQPTTSCMP
jgi:hypothetical protein